MRDSSEWLRLKTGAVIHKASRVFPGVEIGSDSIVEEFVFLGKPHRNRRIHSLLSRTIEDEVGTTSKAKTVIGSRCYIQLGSIIYEGVTMGDDVICTDHVTIGTSSTIGSGTKIHYRAQIFREVEVGVNCRIGGFCCNNSKIGNDSSVYGSLLHRYGKHRGETSDKAPRLGESVIIAFNSTVIGGVTIGSNSYIAAGAIVTKDVPPDSIVIDINGIHHKSQWNGRLSVKT